MRFVLAVFALTGLGGFEGAVADPALEARGKAVVSANCAGCHAIGSTDESPHPEAPPLRTLSQRYPIENLGEALAEGLSSGHPDMPEFVFDVSDVAGVLAYLRSIQQNPGAGK